MLSRHCRWHAFPGVSKDAALTVSKEFVNLLVARIACVETVDTIETQALVRCRRSQLAHRARPVPSVPHRHAFACLHCLELLHYVLVLIQASASS